MSETVYVFFDGETGSLSPSKGDLLTIYFGFFDKDFKLIDELSLKLKPDSRLPVADATALKINKIDIRAHLEDAETVIYSKGRELLLEKVKKHYKKSGRKSCLVPAGYNVRFDIKFLNHYLLKEEEFEEYFDYKILDVMDEVDVLKRHGWLPSEIGKLEKTAEYFGVAIGTAHNAKDDIFMTVGLYLKIREMMESKKNGNQSVDLISLLESE